MVTEAFTSEDAKYAKAFIKQYAALFNSKNSDEIRGNLLSEHYATYNLICELGLLFGLDIGNVHELIPRGDSYVWSWSIERFATLLAFNECNEAFSRELSKDMENLKNPGTFQDTVYKLLEGFPGIELGFRKSIEYDPIADKSVIALAASGEDWKKLVETNCKNDCDRKVGLVYALEHYFKDKMIGKIY